MTGVIVFGADGVFRMVENPSVAGEQNERGPGSSSSGGNSSRGKVLVYLPTEQVVSSYNLLEQILTSLGWERYYGGDPNLFQFHKRYSQDLISLPWDFSKFSTVYMYDIVLKNPNVFQVRVI